MNIGSKTAGKIVICSSKLLCFQYGNILHTGGVGGSKPSASTSRPATFGPVKNVPLGSLEPRGVHSMPKQGQPYPTLGTRDRLRFLSKVRHGAPTECWPWAAATSGAGYGRFKVAGKLYSAHRLAYELENGPIPAKRVANGLILHGCNNPPCCNPSHLRLGSTSDNIADAIAAGRWTQGQYGKATEFWKKAHPEQFKDAPPATADRGR